MLPIETKIWSPYWREVLDISHHFRHPKEPKKYYGNWEFEASVSKVRQSPGYPIITFRSLIEQVAYVTLNNTQFEMFYRGQSGDYKDKNGKTVIYPSICRPEKKFDGKLKASIRQSTLTLRYQDLWELKELARREFRMHYGMDEAYYSLFQHYDVTPTPLIDITQSLRVAASFALERTPTGFLYMFGLPYPHGSISHYIDHNILLIKLQNVSPTNAFRPRYQEGYLVGKFPIRSTKEGGDNLARRLVAKFKLDNTTDSFWDPDFTPMPPEVIYPTKDEAKENFLKLKERFTAGRKGI